jgi:hypothetical protein
VFARLRGKANADNVKLAIVGPLIVTLTVDDAEENSWITSPIGDSHARSCPCTQNCICIGFVLTQRRLCSGRLKG